MKINNSSEESIAFLTETYQWGKQETGRQKNTTLNGQCICDKKLSLLINKQNAMSFRPIRQKESVYICDNSRGGGGESGKQASLSLLSFHLYASHQSWWYNQSALQKHKMKKSSKINLRLKGPVFLEEKSVNPNRSLWNDRSILSWF